MDNQESTRNLDREKKYLLATAGAFSLWLLGLVLGMLVSMSVLIAVLWFYGGMDLVQSYFYSAPPHRHPVADKISAISLPVILGGGVLGFLYGWLLSERLFIKSGYLDAETVVRMQKNMAPTERMERARKAFGFILLIPFFSWMAWVLLTVENKEESDIWRLVVLGPLGIVIYLLFHLWREYFSRKSQ